MLGSLLSWSGLVTAGGKLQLRPLAVGSALLLIVAAHSQLYAMHRFDYNNSHRLTEWIPIAGFLLLRNLTPALRRVHLRLFAWLGEMSLELYILQFHVWMAADAKRIVVLLPAFRGLSFIIATAGFVALAAASNIATSSLIRTLEAQGRAAVYAAAAALLLGMCIVNALPRSCAAGGGGG